MPYINECRPSFETVIPRSILEAFEDDQIAKLQVQVDELKEKVKALEKEQEPSLIIKPTLQEVAHFKNREVSYVDYFSTS
jgi:FtsZ-binding cell division protein ZapB